VAIAGYIKPAAAHSLIIICNNVTLFTTTIRHWQKKTVSFVMACFSLYKTGMPIRRYAGCVVNCGNTCGLSTDAIAAGKKIAAAIDARALQINQACDQLQILDSMRVKLA